MILRSLGLPFSMSQRVTIVKQSPSLLSPGNPDSRSTRRKGPTCRQQTQ